MMTAAVRDETGAHASGEPSVVPGRPSRAPRRAVVTLLALATVVVVVGGLHQWALRDLRATEHGYVAGRKVTACSIARLNPFPDAAAMARLDRTVQDLVIGAHAEAAAVRISFGTGSTAPWVGAGAARRDVRAALDAQVATYAAMMADSPESQARVEELGRRNTEAERSLARLRSALFVGAGEGWEDRFNCPGGGAVGNDG